MDRPTRLAPEHLASAGALLAEAFHTNPAHVYICPEADVRAARLTWLLGGNLRAQRDLRASFCLVDGERVTAMGFFTHSSWPPPPLIRQLRAGLLRAPWRLGVSGVRRMVEVTRAIERHLSAANLPAPYWYLNNMAVADALRGRGVGTSLLRDAMARATALDPACSFALSTQREENMVFYGRLGFEVAMEGAIGRGPHAFRSWIMARGRAADPAPAVSTPRPAPAD